MNLDLSIIILSYNTKDITEECLKRLQVSVNRCQERLKNKIEVIVVDNASIDHSAEMIAKKYPWVKLIKEKVNTGYSKGNNIGLKKTQNPIILLLNSDVFVDEDSLGNALKYFEDSSIDILGPSLKFGNGDFQPSAGNLPNPFNTISWILGVSAIPIIGQFTNPIHPRGSFFSKVRKVGWVTGAFFMFRRRVYEKLKGFDEKVFMYMDEVEFCKRARDANFNIWYIPTLKLTHLHGASSKFDSSLALVSELKGLKYYFQKHSPSVYSLLRPFLITGLIWRILVFSLLGNLKRARAYIEALSVI